MKYWVSFFFLLLLTFRSEGMTDTYDVVIYGGNSAGIIAAIQCMRMGKSVILIAPSKHLGGMTSNGLSCVDITNATLIGGLAREFFHRVWVHYLNPQNWQWEKPHYIKSQALNSIKTQWILEPHVAEKIFNEMLDEARVPIVFNERLERKNGIRKENQNIIYVVMESGRIFFGKFFIDASYEGDLMEAAGVSYIIGREPNNLYNEQSNGIHPKKHMYLHIDPYIIEGDTNSGLLPRIFPSLGGEIGQGDNGVQAYNYRVCLTNVASNAIRIEKPENYHEIDYEILFRAIAAGKRHRHFFKQTFLPNKKIDANNSGPISTDYIGRSWEYAEADYQMRERIAHEHEMWQRGLLWTLQNHPRVPEKVREFYAPWGLPKDEFIDNGHWPYELYVREARRMVSTVVITENTAKGKEGLPSDAIGIAAYHLDAHPVKYYIDENGMLRTEGGIYQKVKPFLISYRAIIPRAEECQNLLVPVCLSASHVAFGSIRMEAVFMVLAQSAATAACLAIDHHRSVQNIAYSLIRKRLLADKQILELR